MNHGVSKRIAVVVPVLNEAESLAELLDDLRGQTRQPDEVVVLDAGSSDESTSLVEARAQSWPALRLLVRPGSPPGRARNAGIEHSECEWIATVDSGSRLGPDWLAKLFGAAAGSSAAVAVGEVEADPRSSFERAAGWFTLKAFKPLGGRRPSGAEYLPAGRHGYCFSRRAWLEAGGYPDRLRFAEDKVFIRRLREAGWATVAVDGAVVRWRPRRNLAEVYSQYRNYAYGDAVACIDRRNELITFAVYLAAASLAAAAVWGSLWAAVVLAFAVAAYLSIFLIAARRALGRDRAVAWVPAIRITVDIAKMIGFSAGLAARCRGRRTSRTSGAPS